MRVAFQGERGAYSEAAATQRWGEVAEPLPLPYLEDVFDAVENGQADMGLVPVENTIEGSVTRTFDLLYERGLRIQGETVFRVVHCLIVNPGVSSSEIRRVYSHPQALGQTREYLAHHGYEAENFYDTAGSVKMIRDQGLRDAGAVASRRAAEIYGMTVLAEGIETNKENYTRFLVVGRGEQPPTGEDKTSTAFIVAHRPGTLALALSALAERGINLTRIESRPLLGKPWEYIFFMDAEGHEKEPPMSDALEDLKRTSDHIKILGSYPRASTPPYSRVGVLAFNAEIPSKDYSPRVSPLEAAVIGARGKMGRWFTAHLNGLGYNVTAIDMRTGDAEGRRTLGETDLVLVSVPISETARVILEAAPHMRKGAVLAEISSVKSEPHEALKAAAGFGVTPLCIHPMFGPSADELIDKTVVVLPVADTNREWELARRLFPRARLTVSDPTTHDRCMAALLSLPYLMNLAFARVVEGMDVQLLRELAGPTYVVQMALSQGVVQEESSLVRELVLENRFSCDLIESFKGAIKELQRALEDHEGFKQLHRSLQESMGADPDYVKAELRRYRAFRAMVDAKSLG